MIYIAADHRGYRLKDELKKWLESQQYEFRDLGANVYDKDDDFPDFAFKLAETVAVENAKGILICGSGAGTSIAANKVRGIRAGLCVTEKQARAARNDDDVNVLCLSADAVSVEDNIKIMAVFLGTLFGSDERFVRRLNKIKKYETEICK